jgi:putative membrane protein
MLAFLRLLPVLVIIFVLVAVGLANREIVTLYALPGSLSSLSGWQWQIALPLFVVAFLSVAFGLIVGFAAEWFRGRKYRIAAKTHARKITRLEKELHELRKSATLTSHDLAPQGDDADLIALIETPKAS